MKNETRKELFLALLKDIEGRGFYVRDVALGKIDGIGKAIYLTVINEDGKLEFFPVRKASKCRKYTALSAIKYRYIHWFREHKYRNRRLDCKRRS